ncbi:hypothetical protein LR48_Vigan04g013500 [Vigna angularis]|uniref:Uncharacterized protein n=1 Tax=Phaseolus angularis TaxID=3914 RepID=A0A0L9UBL1_PHAAN|nr:hypothetical protein LR48_Vigan04g013500 [Vigna angularis]
MLRSGGDAGDERTLEREIGEPIAATSVAAVFASVVAATMDGEGRELPACDERRRRRDFASIGDGSGGSRLPVGWRFGRAMKTNPSLGCRCWREQTGSEKQWHGGWS